MMKNNSSKIKLLLSLIFFIVFCFACVFLYKQIFDNNKKTEQNMINLQMEVRKQDEITSLNRLLVEINPEVNLLETHFAKSSNIVPFLDDIEKSAVDVGASIELSSVNASVKDSGLIVDLKTSGSFTAIYKFLKLLENSPYELEFLSMDIRKSATSSTLSQTTDGAVWDGLFKIQLLSFIP